MNNWQLAFKQVRCDPRRSLLIGAAVALAACAMTGAVLLLAGVRQAVDRTVGRLGADVMIIPRGESVERDFNELLLSGRPASFYLTSAIEQRVRDVPGVLGASGQCYLQSLQNASCCAGNFFLVGFDPASDFVITPWLKGMDREELPADGGWVVVGDRILLRAGQTFDVYGKTFTVAGVLEPTGTGMDWSVFLPRDGLADMAAHSRERSDRVLRLDGQSVSAVFVRGDARVNATNLAERIEQEFPEVQAVLSSAVAGAARRSMHGTTGLLGVILLMLWVTALGISSSMFCQAVRNRRGEFGLLMAKGGDRPFLLGLVTRESAITALPGAVAGAVIAIVVFLLSAARIGDLLGISELVPPLHLLAGLAALASAIATVSAVAAACLPTLRILGSEPYQSLQGGQIR